MHMLSHRKDQQLDPNIDSWCRSDQLKMELIELPKV
jgi:hypothetical protein